MCIYTYVCMCVWCSKQEIHLSHPVLTALYESPRLHHVFTERLSRSFFGNLRLPILRFKRDRTARKKTRQHTTQQFHLREESISYEIGKKDQFRNRKNMNLMLAVEVSRKKFSVNKTITPYEPIHSTTIV